MELIVVHIRQYILIWIQVFAQLQVSTSGTTTFHVNSTYRPFRNINKVKYSIVGQTTSYFFLKACTQARVVLSDNCKNFFPRHRLVISKSDIAYHACSKVPCILRMVNPTQAILSCDTFIPYWVSWTNGQLAIGTGNTVGKSTLLTTEQSINLTINYLGIKSQDSADFKFTEASSSYATVFHTTKESIRYRNTNKIKFSDVTQTTITFSVKSCNDSRISFNDNCETFSRRFLFSIRSDKIIFFYCLNEICTFIHNVLSAQGLLSCDHFMQYWVSWKNGQFGIGTGSEVDHEIIMRVNKTLTFTINYSGIKSMGDADFMFTDGSLVDVSDFDAGTQCPIEEECTCPCEKVKNNVNVQHKNYSSLEELKIILQDNLKKLEASNTIDEKETSAYKATKICAPDERQSSAVMGFIGACLVFLPFVLAIVLDSIRLFCG